MPPLFRPLRLALLLGGALALSGCLAPQTDYAYPVSDAGPNPAPLPGYRVVCESNPPPFFGLFGAVSSGCRQEFVPVYPSAVVRARG